LLGLPPGTAAAAAILQRVLVTGTATVMGLVAYGIARRRFHLSGLGALRARADRRRRPGRRPAARPGYAIGTRSARLGAHQSVTPSGTSTTRCGCRAWPAPSSCVTRSTAPR